MKKGKTIVTEDLSPRTMGKTELARLYAPGLTDGAALNRLADWIGRIPELTEQLARTGYRRRQHMLTPGQVELILRYLGQPGE